MLTVGRSNKTRRFYISEMRRCAPSSSSSKAKSTTATPTPHKKIKVKEDDDDGGGGRGNADSGPANWREVYANIVEMRADKSAPVDTMGCERTFDKNAPPKVYRPFPSLGQSKFARGRKK